MTSRDGGDHGAIDAARAPTGQHSAGERNLESTSARLIPKFRGDDQLRLHGQRRQRRDDLGTRDRFAVAVEHLTANRDGVALLALARLRQVAGLATACLFPGPFAFKPACAPFSATGPAIESPIATLAMPSMTTTDAGRILANARFRTTALDR